MTAPENPQELRLRQLAEIAGAQLAAQQETNRLLHAILTGQGARPFYAPPAHPGPNPASPSQVQHQRLPDVVTVIGSTQVGCSCGWMKSRFNTNRAWRKHLQEVSRG